MKVKIPNGKVDVFETILLPAKLSGKVYNFSGSINIDADVDCDIETICDRCLVPVKTKLSFPSRLWAKTSFTAWHYFDMGDIAEETFIPLCP